MIYSILAVSFLEGGKVCWYMVESEKWQGRSVGEVVDRVNDGVAGYGRGSRVTCGLGGKRSKGLTLVGGITTGWRVILKELD